MDFNLNNEYRNIVIVTHSKRMRSFLYKNFYNINKKIRFRNCAIIKIFYDINNDKTVAKLIYSGETDKNENRNNNSYYTLSKFNNLNVCSDSLIVPQNINIFLIRHAQGYHNANNTFFKKFIASFNWNILKDPQLTQIGNSQAINAGKFLKIYFKEHNLNTNLCIIFCSVLLRTRETINIILDELEIYNKDIIILPCSNEISSFDEPEYISFDNHMCKADEKQRIVYKCDNIGNKNISRNINWTFFEEFKKKYNKYDIDNTNMIYQTYNIAKKIIKDNQ
jgi:bisphosphoglycerate-dependent phosphoglycerate mutase